MSLTAADVRTVTFRRAALGRRGYEEEDVDRFLDLVEGELVGRPTNPVASQSLSEVGRPVDIEQPVGQSVDSLRALRLLRATEETADRVAREADADSRRLLREAQTQSELMISEAKERAANSDRDCRARAIEIEAEAQANNRSIVGHLMQKRDQLIQEIAELEQHRLSLHWQLRQWLSDQLNRVADDDSLLTQGTVTAAIDPAA